MYEKATPADVSIVAGVIIILLSLLIFPWWGTDFFLYTGAGVGLLALGFILDRVHENRRRRLDIERLRDKVPGFIEESEGLLIKGEKALESEKYNRALNIFLSAAGTLEMAEKVLRETGESHRLKIVLRDLSEARKGVSHARAGIALVHTGKAKALYESGKYEKALEEYEEALNYLREASEVVNFDSEIRKLEENILKCRKRIGEGEMNALIEEDEKMEELFREYQKRGLLFDAREVLNEMEARIQRASDIADRFEFNGAMKEINLALNRVREGKSGIESAILERLKSRKPHTEGITELADKIDPELKKVAVDVGEEVEVYSGYNFRAGAVRIQLTVVNRRPSTISEVRLKTLTDERVLSFVRVTPDYPVQYNEIKLGTLPPGEKRTVNLYFDPQVCGTLSIDFTLNYLDSSGNYHSIVGERRRIEIPEPEIGEGKGLNTSYLNRLIENERNSGERVLYLPAGLEPEEAFSIVQEVFEERGLTPVWHREEEEGLSAGYYGKCEEEECAVMLSLSNRQVRISAHTPGEEGVTPLLTALSADIRERLEREGHRGVNISLTIKDSVLNRTSFNL